MSVFNINAKLDTASLETIRAFENYQAILEPALEVSMKEGIDLLQGNASAYMWATFQNPTGPTEDDSWQSFIDPYQSWLENTAPQATRLEYGFSGMTDSLGRYYPLWPGGYRSEYWHGYRWAAHTEEVSQRAIQDIFQTALDFANIQIGENNP